MADDIFKLVKEEDIPKVLKELETDWPKHFVLHQIITVMAEYKRAGTKFQHTLYLYGDYDNGVYLNKLLMELPKGPSIYLYVYTKNSDLSDLKKALIETKLIPRKKEATLSICFTMVPHRFLTVVEEAFAIDQIKCLVHSNNLYWFPPDKEQTVEPLPEELSLKFLDGSHAEVMNANWPHRSPGSEIVHREHLEKNFGLGLFRKSDGKMVCSTLSNFTGGIFVLYSEPEVRGKGYAKLLVQQMVREIRNRGRIPFCTVIQGNKPSEKVFTTVGFEVFTEADYIFPDI